MKILIPNATGPSNIGDQSMLIVLLDLLRQVYKDAEIVVHTSNPEMYSNKFPHSISPSIYQIVGLHQKGEWKQIFGVIQYLIFLFITVNGTQIKTKNSLARIFNDYKTADLIVFVGGGYLRSRPGWSQSLNLVLQLSMFYLASACKARTIVAPISFGPFASFWQAKLSAWFLKRLDFVSAREEISYELMDRCLMKNVVMSSDHALLLRRSKKLIGEASVIGFTIRNWSKNVTRQKNLECAYVQALHRFHLVTGWTVQPIIQATAINMPNEDDRFAVGRVYRQLKKLKVIVKKPSAIKNLSDAINIYSRLGLLLGMRMHSNIIAATQGVPFVAVSYEYKTEGIAKQIDMQKYCIKYEQVDKDKLFNLLVEVYGKRKYLKNKLTNSLATIQNVETQKWNNYLSNK